MKAAILTSDRTVPGSFLRIAEVPRPEPQAGYVLLRVLACGVCRTDLHIAEGDLPPVRPELIPGHQIVGEVAGPVPVFPGLGALMAIAGTVTTGWKISAISLSLRDTR
jgi:propanol-preferring alcohol dehydrogenase